MQNNSFVSIATEASSLALINSEVIVRSVFAFCSDPLSFRQTCTAFRKSINKQDALLWSSGRDVTIYEGALDVGFATPIPKFLWNFGAAPREWYSNPYYSFLLGKSEHLGMVRSKLQVSLLREEREDGGARKFISMAVKNNNPEYLDYCPPAAIMEATSTWQYIPDASVLSLFLACEEDVFNSFFNFLGEMVFRRYGLRACSLVRATYEPEDVYTCGVPILAKMYTEGYEPETFEGLALAEEFYGQMVDKYVRMESSRGRNKHRV